MAESVGIPKLGPVIAIDGPAGTGKSSATKRLADLLGFTHVDTGALYRAVAFLCLKDEAFDSPALGEKAAGIAKKIHLEFKRMPKKTPANRIFADGQDVTEFIRTPEVSMAASKVSAHPEVRSALLGLQRRLGCMGPSILEGRDIGTVIFPDADVKFFLTASVEERAKRRLSELEALGSDVPSFEEIKDQISTRDHGDSTRAIAPLKKAPDAIELDTTPLTLDQVVSFLAEHAKKKLAHYKFPPGAKS